MTKDEIVDGVIELLRQHKEGLRGSIHQDPYKHDFFVLFAEAFNGGMMRGHEDVLYADGLVNSVTVRAPDLCEGEAWRALYTFWADWTYAWEHVAERKLWLEAEPSSTGR
ncbi:MAG TPA: hypothetical protein VHU22_19030 [Xanthobacteraceae bacterium]|jgi:hypothetical protein|nr:hypothetical protein [Xanthobacteraceae bacterium]